VSLFTNRCRNGRSAEPEGTGRRLVDAIVVLLLDAKDLPGARRRSWRSCPLAEICTGTGRHDAEKVDSGIAASARGLQRYDGTNKGPADRRRRREAECRTPRGDARTEMVFPV
jgi:hypothetical protein